MNTAKPNLSKYRPVLTADQISHIIGLCKKDGSAMSLLCISVLAPFEYKIQNGSISAAYTSDLPKDMESDLGFSGTHTNNIIEKINTNPGKLAYSIWRLAPETCTVEQIKTARDYAFTHGLLTTEESIQYDKDLFGL